MTISFFPATSNSISFSLAFAARTQIRVARSPRQVSFQLRTARRAALHRLFLLEAEQVRSSIVTRDVEGHCLTVNLLEIEVRHDEFFAIEHGLNNVMRIGPHTRPAPPLYPLTLPYRSTHP